MMLKSSVKTLNMLFEKEQARKFKEKDHLPFKDFSEKIAASLNGYL